jgi:cell wall-associated NlpC family hydrolase
VFHGRKRLVSLSAASVLALGVLSAQPAAQAEPDIDDVKAKVDRLYHEAEQASERYNDIQLRLEELQGDLTSLKADEKRQGKRLEAAREQVEDSVIAQYQGEGMATLGDVIVAEDPSAFLADLDALSSFNSLQAQQFEDYSTERKALEIRTASTQERVDEVAAVEREAAREKKTIDRKVAEAEQVLEELEAEERARLERQQAREQRQTVSRANEREPAPAPSPSPSPSPTPAPSASGRAGAAVQYALAQVGDAYVYGATGESAFDCSGLTMRAWAQAGVSLPHSSSAQMGSGPRVSSSALQPGDLVFYYSPVSHVGIYIGGGRIVHAANPSTGVSIAGVFSMPFSGAVRPG